MKFLLAYLFLGSVWSLANLLKYFAETTPDRRCRSDIVWLLSFNFVLAPITLPATLLYRALR